MVLNGLWHVITTIFFEMDVDFSHDPKDLVRLLEACETKADVAVGSRYCSGGKIANWPFGRILMSYFASYCSFCIVDPG